MNSLRKFAWIWILVAAAMAAHGAENLAVPGQVQFAGRIEGMNLTAEGAEATEVKAGVRGVTFSLFAEQSGGAALWVESQNVSVSGDGAYSTLLGAETQGGIPQSIFSDSGASGAARWLEVSYIGADGVQVTQPRVLLVSVPYAMKAGDAATLGGLPVSAFVLNGDAVASRVSDNGGLAATRDSTPSARVTDSLPTAAVTPGSIAKFNSANAADVVDSIITEASGKIGIGTTTPVGTIDVGGWPAIPNDIQGVGSTISGDVFMGNTNGGIGRFRMASNALQGFFSWNQYYNGTNHKGMDGTAPGWRVNIGGTGAEDAYYVERSPATANGHVPARLFVVNGNGRVGINTGTAAPLATLDVGGWPAIPNDIQGVGTTISGDVFMGNTNGGIGRYRMASNALQGFFSWNQYYNGVGHKGMDATAPGWRINVGGTGIEDAFYVERSPATANLHAPARLFQVSGSGNVGIGTTAPTAPLHVVGNTLTTGTATVGGFTLTGNGAAVGRVLTSDANGAASWQTAPGAGGTAADVNCPAPCVASSEIVDDTIADADIAPAANISPTKIAGTAATLGANSFAGDQNVTGNAVVSNNLTVDTTTLVVNAASNRVGVGTASPTVALEVNGTVKASGMLFGANATPQTQPFTGTATNLNCTGCITSAMLDSGTDLSDGGDITGDLNVNGTVDINSAGGSPAGKLPGASMSNARPTRANIAGINLKINGQTMVGTNGVFGFSQNVNSPNVVIGYGSNIIDAGVFGASILGGGAVGTYETNPTAPNHVTDIFGIVVGGTANRAGDAAGSTSDRGWAFVGGGRNNIAAGDAAAVVAGVSNFATGQRSFVGGGQGNLASGGISFIGGGQSNVASGAIYATIGGGFSNDATGQYSTVGGGNNNTASGTYAVVAGGWNNVAGPNTGAVGGGVSNQATASQSTVAGGNGNIANQQGSTVGGGWTNTASGFYSTVPGGISNVAGGQYSFAAGNRAKANGFGSFVWADGTNADAVSNLANEFVVRSTGGVYLLTNAAMSVGCWLNAGAGAWSCSSDRNEKENFQEVSGNTLLQKLDGIPITTWNFKTQDAKFRHLGPMAQDFRAAFGLGEDDRSIASVDAQGVALAGVQALYRMVREKDAQLAAQQAEIGELREMLMHIQRQMGTQVSKAVTSGQ